MLNNEATATTNPKPSKSESNNAGLLVGLAKKAPTYRRLFIFCPKHKKGNK